MDAYSPHQAVLLNEAIEALNVRPGGAYVDATFGRGGHARALLQTLDDKGWVLALDQDPEAERYARSVFANEPRLHFEHANFDRLAALVGRYGRLGQVHGVLFDLGVSSPQLDDPTRGFSFSKDGPLDMRMNSAAGVSAADWLATVSEAELERVLETFGEERFHRRIAQAIIAARRQTPLITTAQLAAVVAKAMPMREKGQHPATRTFQAVRIAINHELEALQAALEQALAVLAAAGRLVVISFHSLEDRIVKRFMRAHARGQEWPLDLPVPVQASTATLRLIGRALRPGIAELRRNPRARSATLRVAERLA